MKDKLKRYPWTRGRALTLFDKIGVQKPSAAYRALRARWASQESLPAELRVHLVLGGAVCEWLSDLAQLQIIRCLERKKRFNEEFSAAKAASSTLPALVTDFGAILSLCRIGYDVQARTLLRSFIERLDLLICVWLDEDFASHYLNAGSFEESRAFFYKNISGGKLSRRARTLFREAYPEADFVHEWLLTDWRNDTSLMLAAAAHANHTVSVISLFPNLGRGRSNAVGLLGHPTTGSNRTISSLIYACMPLHFLFSDFPYDEIDQYLGDWSVRQDMKNKDRFSDLS